MGDEIYRIPEEWQSRLGGPDSSGWLGAFVASPKQAVADLLWDEFYFGPLNLIDRRQIVTTWLDLLGNVDSFAQTLDRELTAWVRENWGRFERPAESLASAWSCLSNIVEISANLQEESTLRLCADELRQHFEEHTEFLGSFSTAPASDPLGAYLGAVAEFQGDNRSLAPFWHNLSEIPDGVPFYHARYAMLGLRRIRSDVASINGTLRAEVVRGLLTLAKSFDRLAVEGKLGIDVARDTFWRIARQTEAAYRDSKGWVLYSATAEVQLSDRAEGWLKVVPTLARARQKARERVQKGEHRARHSIEADPNWSRMAREIASGLRASNQAYVPKAIKLLIEERRYAQATGDTYHVSRSLRNFASGVYRFNPTLALRWTVEALQWDPRSHYGWTIIRTVLLAEKRVEEASQFAWVAWKRFPENVEVYNALADVLNSSGRLHEGEFIYRQAIKRFPNDIPARNGLAATLGRMNKVAENEEEYRRNIEAGLANATTFVGLAQIVLAKGDRAEAMVHVERALEMDPTHFYAQKLQRRLKSKADPSADQIDDSDQVPEVLSELSTFPIDFGPESIEWEPEKQLVEMSQQQPESRDEPTPENEIRPRTDVAANREPEQQPESATKEPLQAPTEQLPEAVNLAQIDVRRREGAERFEVRAGRGNLMQPYQFKPTKGIVVAALVAEAYFYRNWARTAKAELSVKRRKIAHKVLRRAEELSPQNAEVLAERAALVADGGNLASAREALITATESTHPGAVSLLVLRARMEREIARKEKRRHNSSSLEELCEIPQRLRERQPGLSPLFDYQRGLAALALLNGDARKSSAAHSFSSFRRKLNHLAETQSKARGAHDETGPRRFYHWLEEHVNMRVFEGLTDIKEVSLEDVTFLDDHWSERRSAIEEIEDLFVNHLNLGQTSAELFSS